MRTVRTNVDWLSFEEYSSFPSTSKSSCGMRKPFPSIFRSIGPVNHCDNECPGHMTTAVLEAVLNLCLCVNRKVSEYCFSDVQGRSFQGVG